MAKPRPKLMTYDELMEKYPDWIFADAGLYYQEVSPELTERGRLIKKVIVGSLLKFIQDQNLTRHIICETAPDIPDDLVIYFRDLLPEALEFSRQVVGKWYGRFDRNRNADPSDIRVLEKGLIKLRQGKFGS